MKTIIRTAAAFILAAMLAAFSGCAKTDPDKGRMTEEEWAAWLEEFNTMFDEDGVIKMDHLRVEPDFTPRTGEPFRVTVYAVFVTGYEKPVSYDVAFSTEGPVAQTNINEFVCSAADSCRISAELEYKGTLYTGQASFAAVVSTDDNQNARP